MIATLIVVLYYKLTEKRLKIDNKKGRAVSTDRGQYFRSITDGSINTVNTADVQRVLLGPLNNSDQYLSENKDKKSFTEDKQASFIENGQPKEMSFIGDEDEKEDDDKTEENSRDTFTNYWKMAFN